MNEITTRYLELIDLLIENGSVKDRTDFAKSIGISTSSITEMDKGRANVGLASVQKTVMKFPDINLDWLMRGEGEIFKAKSAENLTNLKGKVKGKEISKERKVQKTLPIENEAHYPPVSSKTWNVAEKFESYDVGEKEDIRPPGPEFIENVFTGFTDEEISEVFEDHLTEMFESGRAYPAAIVHQLIREKDEELLKAQKQIWVLQNQSRGEGKNKPRSE